MNYVQRLRKWYNRPKSTIVQYIETFVIIVPIAFIIRTYFYGLYQVPTGSMETTMLVGERFFADKFTVLFQPIKHGDIIAFNDPNFEYSDNYWKNLFERYVYGPQNWTKRVIGIPGDHIVGKMEDGKPVVYRNDVKLDEPYLNKYPLIYSYRDGCLLPQRSYDESKPYEEQQFYRMNQDEVMLAKTLIERQGYSWSAYPQTPSFDKYGRNVDEYDIYLGPNEYWVMGDNRLGSFDSRFWGKLDGKLIHAKIVLRLWSIDSDESWFIIDLLKHPIDFWTRIRWNRFFNLLY